MSKHEEAVDFMRLSSEAETQNRMDALQALKFANGDQWPSYAIQSRGMERPQLTINETDAYCRQVENQQRQQRPRIDVHATNLFADPKIAKVLKGICRHIEVNSNGENAYDLAFSFAIRMGWGYFRLYRDWIREDSFDQDIFIGSIENPFTVYFDPNSNELDGSDAQRCLITDEMTKKEFKKKYPGAKDSAGFIQMATGDSKALVDWASKDNIRLAEYYYIDLEDKMLVKLSNGDAFWEDELPPLVTIQQAGLSILGDRRSKRKKIKWCKVTAFETLETKDIPGRYIPIVPVYGRSIILEGKRQRFGLVRDAMDPARMNNFWYTLMTETIALGPKPKWTMAEGQDEGFENEWAQANLSPKSTLHYKQKDLDGQPAPPPERVQAEPPPEGAIAAMSMSSQALQKVLGIVDPAQRISGNVSGKALISEQQKSDNSVFNYYDNLTTSIKQCGRIILSWCPVVYDTERVLRIIGDDGQPDLTTVNETSKDAQGAEIILNDLTVGEYDVVMDTGPGYNSKRQEALAAFGDLMQGPLGEVIAQVGPDLVVRLHDAPGMDVLADRLAANNPMAQIDEKSDVPPQAQMMIKKLQQTVQQQGQQMQAMQMEIKYKGQLEVGKQQAETQREHMKQVAAAHDTEKRAETAVTVAHLQAVADSHDTNTWAAENIEQQRMGDKKDVLIQHMKAALEMAITHENNEAKLKIAKEKPAPEKTA